MAAAAMLPSRRDTTKRLETLSLSSYLASAFHNAGEYWSCHRIVSDRVYPLQGNRIPRVKYLGCDEVLFNANQFHDRPRLSPINFFPCLRKI
jgi:hypothetical protein